MGLKAEESLTLSLDELKTYLHANHSVYMDVDGKSYYLTDCNDSFWRAQYTNQYNDKNHYVDASDLVETLGEFLILPFMDDKSITDVFDRATFYASIKPEA